MTDTSSLIKFYSNLTKTALCDNIEKKTIHEPNVFVINSPDPFKEVRDHGPNQNLSYKKQVALDLSARDIFIQEEDDNYVSVKYFYRNHAYVSFGSNFRAITQSEIFPFFVKAQIFMHDFQHYCPIDIDERSIFLNDFFWGKMHIKFIFHKDILNVEPKQITFYEYDALLYTYTTLQIIRQEYTKTKMFVIEPFVFKNFMCLPLTMFHDGNLFFDDPATIQDILTFLSKELYLEQLIALQKK